MKPLIFYLDDSIDALELAKAIAVNDNKFDLIGFKSEREFMFAIEQNNPDGVMIDLNLGKTMTGTIISSKLRKLYPNLPIAIYTNYDKNRVRKLINIARTGSESINVWTKSEVGVTNLSSHVMDLVSKPAISI